MQLVAETAVLMTAPHQTSGPPKDRGRLGPKGRERVAGGGQLLRTARRVCSASPMRASSVRIMARHYPLLLMISTLAKVAPDEASRGEAARVVRSHLSFGRTCRSTAAEPQLNGKVVPVLSPQTAGGAKTLCTNLRLFASAFELPGAPPRQCFLRSTPSTTKDDVLREGSRRRSCAAWHICSPFPSSLVGHGAPRRPPLTCCEHADAAYASLSIGEGSIFSLPSRHQP